ncbi:crotonobetainyl-CoA:carnitine CoA-transferase CaiB-like acyl-CoA transferase [Arthrobacter silviterrae]|uniref:Uncharacterized protein n=1 Tax=Arthrobacter silviterrae TaxID=2026658 RepID=A0ABX0D9U2_9MICC|nr:MULTISPECIES: hypothetical protein [Arthrobacter]MCU6480715.1 hypothetical protein [Arthrobacter sp. A2-55]MDQ0278502.1 crotonobetainyl-CoA:carnitine CoA-transferase CaiB-like acyl-CoA transferase [Arthrobacter silviterrae]NGN82240.1 hypothetical protein [Arthrobacter silviterrae]
MSKNRVPALAQIAMSLAGMAAVFFVVASLSKSATSGFGAVVGNISWYGLLLSLIALAVVGCTTAARALLRHRATR